MVKSFFLFDLTEKRWGEKRARERLKRDLSDEREAPQLSSLNPLLIL